MGNWTVSDVTGHAGVTGRYLANAKESTGVMISEESYKLCITSNRACYAKLKKFCVIYRLYLLEIAVVDLKQDAVACHPNDRVKMNFYLLLAWRDC